MDVPALNTNPSITPKISSIVAPRNLDATNITRKEVSNAPMKAAETMVRPESAAGRDVPIKRVAAAAPVPAPALTPMMCGSASGLRNKLCIWRPASARDDPASNAVSILGSLSFRNMAESRLTRPLPPTHKSAAARSTTARRIRYERRTLTYRLQLYSKVSDNCLFIRQFLIKFTR